MWIHYQRRYAENFCVWINSGDYVVYISNPCAYYLRGDDSMNKKQQEQQNRQKNLNKFNSITEKVKPENQNQGHNIRSEEVELKNRQV